MKDELKLKEHELSRLQESWGTQQENVEWEINSGITITLEGWAYSIEQHSGEAENHTKRVTELTIELAKLMGIPDDRIVHIRRGAILHDIGKTGIPDFILKKSTPLSSDEWEIVRYHPTYAFNLLSTIEYLRPALNIPYCHHERWDGTGFPRGLKGEEIPLEARIFTVIDVWEALIRDRPYRQSWPVEKALTYINEQTGKYFDPKVVEVFSEMMRVK